MKKPVIAIPIGDPAGIGPEIVLKAVTDKQLCETASCIVVGERSVLEQAAGYIGISPHFNELSANGEGALVDGAVNLLDLQNIDTARFKTGTINAACGRAAYEYIAYSIELAQNRVADAVATSPINKEALRAANVPFIGHTEIFASLTGTEDPLTMFEVHGLRVFFLSRHISLRQACDMVSRERIEDYVRRCTEALKKLGVEEGTMAIAGLNPHSGEHGLFGDEEMLHIEPAVAQLRKEGYDVVGPVGADSVFHLALQGHFNSVLSLYHDQGHIATKTYDFERTIAITNGMPILRTSVDHGTAFDIAGSGQASAVSMKEAILLAAKYAPHFSHPSW